MKVCKFNGGELKELDQVIKCELRLENMAGEKMGREDGGRGIKSLKDIYKESRLLHDLLRKQVGQCCMEKREHQGGDFYSRRNNEDNGGR